jgi:galactokinase
MVRSPGRVNLIGDHTDYNDGFVLPLAIDRAVWIALRPRRDRMVRAWTELMDETVEFSLDSLARGGGWVAYLQGVANELLHLGDELIGWDGVIASDIPSGAGLSSSAALELGVARAFANASGLNWDPVNAALLCQRAENDWVGMSCGIMDQLICSVGEVDRAMLIDCRDLSRREVRLPDSVAVVVLDTGTRRDLVDSMYNERRESCEAVAHLFGVRALRDLSMERLDSDRGKLGAVAYRRARHVISENARTVEMAERLAGNHVIEAGRLMSQSHISLRDDFEVSSPLLDAMTAAALASLGCHGARMTGGGFGGSCVALVAADHVEKFQAEVLERYRASAGPLGSAINTRAASGTSIVLLD